MDDKTMNRELIRYLKQVSKSLTEISRSLSRVANQYTENKSNEYFNGDLCEVGED